MKSDKEKKGNRLRVNNEENVKVSEIYYRQYHKGNIPY